MNQNIKTESINETREKIVDMINKISNEALLNRVYRFVKYIYIYKT